MRVSDVLTIERNDLGLNPKANSEAEDLADRLLVAEAMAEVFRTVQPVSGRYIVELSNEQEVKLPYPMLYVEALFLEGQDITGCRVLPQQMSMEP